MPPVHQPHQPTCHPERSLICCYFHDLSYRRRQLNTITGNNSIDHLELLKFTEKALKFASQKQESAPPILFVDLFIVNILKFWKIVWV
jgi:hypothetical protein